MKNEKQSITNPKGLKSVRKSKEFCEKAIRESWDWDFLRFILNLRKVTSLRKLALFKKDGRGYFDSANSLLQQEVFEGIQMKKQTIRSVTSGTDERIKYIYLKTVELLRNDSNASMENLKEFSEQFVLNAEDKISNLYGMDEYWEDFQIYILDDVKKPGNLEYYWNHLKDPDVLIDSHKFDKITRAGLDPNTDTGKIVNWILENPKMTKSELQSHVKAEIQKGSLKMSPSSMYKLIDKSILIADKISKKTKF